MDAFRSKLKRLTGSFADPRLFQIFSLGILLAAGAYFRDFSIRPAQVVLTFAAGLLMQTACWTLTPSKPRSVRSAIITCLSLSLLLRADNLIAHPIAAAAAISSKSLFRFRDKHLFNPATFGVIFAIVLASRHLGIAGAVGSGFRDRRMGADARHAGDESRAARRHQLDVSRLLSRRARDADRIPRPALGRVDASARERRAAAVCVLHDFRSDDRAQRPARTDRACRTRRRARVRVAVPALPHQRTHLGFVYRGAVRSAVGRDLARAQIRMDPKWRWPCSLNESRFSSR